MPDSPEDAPTRKLTLKPKEFERVNAVPGTLEKSDAHDVFALRQQLRAREQAAGMDAIKEQPVVPKRRKRDFRLAGIGGYFGLMLLGGVIVSFGGGLPGFIFGLIWGGALGLFYLAGLWWVMFHLMDDY